MALSGKTSNFELKYPALVDDIVMGKSGNDFKEMMDSVDITLRDSIFKTVEPGTDLNTLTTGLFKLAWPLTNDPSPSLGLRYLMAMSGPPGNAQYYFADNGKIYYRFSTPSGSTTTGEWKEIATEEIVGDLADLTTTTKTNLVSAINEIAGRSGITDLGTLADKSNALLDITDTGVYKFNVKAAGTLVNEYILIVTKETYTLGPSTTITIMQVLIDYQTVMYGGDVPGYNIKIRRFTPSEGISDIPWHNLPMGIANNLTTQNAYEALSAVQGYNLANMIGTLNSLETNKKDNLVNAINELKTNTAKKLSGTSNVMDYDNIYYEDAGIYLYTDTTNQMDSIILLVDEDVGPSKTEFLLTYDKPIMYRNGDSGEFQEWKTLSSKKYSTIVIGNSGSGLTANDVDYLYEEGSDFGSVLTSAINKLTSSGAKGGEIKILSGTYTLTSAVTTSGTASAPIKITGEGLSTIITSTSPSYYLTLQHCELCNLKLDTEVRITTNGYVNIHDCEIVERIYFNNSSIVRDIFIHDNNFTVLSRSTGTDLLFLSGSGGIYNFQVYNNYCYKEDGPFNFLYVATTKSIYSSSIRNNHCPLGRWNSSTYGLNSTMSSDSRCTMTGNTFFEISFRGAFWCISNNHITNVLHLHDGDYLDVMNNRVDNMFIVASGLTYANITGNVINAIATSLPYVNLGTNARFVNNTIRDTNFSTTYIPGYDTATNKWGNNMWADGIDRLVFANGEGIGEGQGDA